MDRLRAALVISIAVSALLPVAPAWSHGGGLDSLGCHRDRKRGGYHCHRGALAGQSFGSQGEAVDALSRAGGGVAAPAAKAGGDEASCNRRPTCKAIPTCEMAYHYLNSCGLRALDRDGDGVPCESGPC